MRFFLLAAAQVWEPAGPARLEPALREAVTLQEKETGPQSAAYAEACSQFARFLSSSDRAAEAGEWFRRALAIRESAGDLESLAVLGPPDALASMKRAVELRGKGAAPAAELVRALRRYGDMLETSGDAAGAEAAYRQAIAAGEKIQGPDFGVACNDLGLLLENREDMRGAEQFYRRALAALEKAHGPKHPEVGSTLNNLAGAVGAQGRLAEAEVYLRRAVSTLESTVGGVHPRTAMAAANFGDLLTARGRPAEARGHYERAASAYDKLGDARAAQDVRSRIEAK